MFAIVALVTVGCGDDLPASADRNQPAVLATTSIWADIVSRVACDPPSPVGTIVPKGGDPHAFEPSLADRGRLEAAQLVVANGLGLEEGIADTLAAAAGSGTPVLRVGDVVETLATDGPDTADPHVWLDPVRVADVLPSIAEALVRHTDLDAKAAAECVSSYRDELTALDAHIAARLTTIPVRRRALVTNHDAFAYFADRYDLVVVGTVIPASSTLAQSNPAALAELAEAIQTAGVTAIFADAAEATDVVEKLAASMPGVEVVRLQTGSLGEEGGGAETYLELLRTAADLIGAALGGN